MSQGFFNYYDFCMLNKFFAPTKIKLTVFLIEWVYGIFSFFMFFNLPTPFFWLGYPGVQVAMRVFRLMEKTPFGLAIFGESAGKGPQWPAYYAPLGYVIYFGLLFLLTYSFACLLGLGIETRKKDLEIRHPKV